MNNSPSTSSPRSATSSSISSADEDAQQQDESEQQQQEQEPAINNQQLEETKAFDVQLSREMMQLSLEARNDIIEEIHGVKCIAPIETPDLLERAFVQLEAQINMIIGSSTSIPVPNLPTNSLILARNMGDQSYTNSRDFKLLCLRCELFDARKAALRLCEHVGMIHSLFGEQCLLRKPSLHIDFTKAELRLIRKGYFQFLPFRDRSGRRIFVDFPSEDTDNMTADFMAKFLIYLSHSLSNDIETLRKGIVVVIWFDANYQLPAVTLPPRRSNLENFGKWVCVRISAIHVCSPDTPAFRFRRTIITLRTIQDQRSRLQLHVGKPFELCYYLQGFGIPTENIPMTWSGNIKTTNFRNWMKLRKAIEEDNEAKRQYLRNNRVYNSRMSNVVECPNSTDILFRQGTSLSHNPGNASFRCIIEDSVVEELRKKSQPIDAAEGTTSSTNISKLVSRLFKNMKKDRYRFLVWSPNHNGQKYGCWCVITNKEQVYSKIDYAVREHIRSVSSGGTDASAEVLVSRSEMQRSNLQTNDSSTSIFQVESKQGESESCAEAVSNLFCGTSDIEASMPNKRSKTSASNSSEGGENQSADPSSGDEDSNC